MALYAPWATELFEPGERASFLAGRTTEHPWFLEGRAPVDDAIDDAGFDVVHFEPRAPLYSEHLLRHEPTVVVDQLLLHSQPRLTGVP